MCNTPHQLDARPFGIYSIVTLQPSPVPVPDGVTPAPGLGERSEGSRFSFKKHLCLDNEMLRRSASQHDINFANLF